MQAQRFGDLLADRKHRVERGHRLRKIIAMSAPRTVRSVHPRGLSEIEQRAVTSAQRRQR